ASLEFSYTSASDQDATRKLEESPYHFALAARRTATEDSDALVLGWLGMFDISSGTVDNTPTAGNKTSTDKTSYDVVVGAGPVYKPNDRTNVAMYGTFELQHDKSDAPLPTGKETHQTIGIPGWNVAAEVELASWLQFRTGMRSRYTFVE